MPAPLKTYDLKATVLTVDGARIEGFSPDEAIEFEWAEDLGEMTVSADGRPTFSRTNNPVGFLNVTVMETSLAYKVLAAQQQAQALETPIGRRVLFMRDLINGDEISESYATFVGRPTIAKGKAVGTRTFRIALPNAGDPGNVRYGALITI